MVRDLDANARMTIAAQFIGGFLQNLILLFENSGSKDGIALANARYVKRNSAAELGRARLRIPDPSRLPPAIKRCTRPSWKPTACRALSSTEPEPVSPGSR
jgi:hypothetical protein